MNLPKNVKLDNFDELILHQIQNNSDQTHAQIGKQIGLSSSAVRRRLQRLKDRGVVECQIAILDPDKFGVTLIIELCFSNETPQMYADFDKQMASLQAVQQSYHVAGDTDYVLVVHGPSLQWYEEWSKRTFMSDPNIRRYSSRVVWSRKKFSPSVTHSQAE